MQDIYIGDEGKGFPLVFNPWVFRFINNVETTN